MAGEKGKRKRSSAEEHRGGEVKGKPSAQEHRGGEPKIRKLAQEDMGKREGKLQTKGKMRRLEEEKVMEEHAPTPRDEVVETADDPAFEKTQEKIALFKAVVEHNCDHMVIPDYAAPLFPGGAAQVEELNAGVRASVKEFKEHAAMRLKEFEAQGYLDYYPDPHGKVPSYIFNDQGKADAQAI